MASDVSMNVCFAPPDDTKFTAELVCENLHTSIPCRIGSADGGILRISTRLPLEVGAEVSVQFRNTVARGEVLFCGMKRQCYYSGVELRRPGAAEGRREPRFPVEWGGRVVVLGEDREMSCRIVDLSASGLGMMTPEPLPIDEAVAIELRLGVVLGTVRHCAWSGMDGYRCGISAEELLPALEKPGRDWKRSVLRFLGWTAAKP